jgi:tetratricopeptide (TPR) repeat protein
MSEWEIAIDNYDRAIAMGYASAGLLNNMAYALIKSGHRDEAVEWLNRAIATDRTLADAHYQRGWLTAALAAQEGRPVPLQAVADIERAIELRPSSHRMSLAAANIHASFTAEIDAAAHRARATDYLLEALRLGLDASELPPSGPLAPIASQARASSEFVAALAQGARAVRSPPPGLVDSLAGLE